jgi:hypothetical protein
VSWEFGEGDREGREPAENKESARSIFPVLTSFDEVSDVGESVGLAFDTGEDVIDGGLDACEM